MSKLLRNKIICNINFKYHLSLSRTGNSYELRGILIGSNQAVNSLDFDSTGTLILGTSNDFASRVWGIADHRLRVSEKNSFSSFIFPKEFFFISIFVLSCAVSREYEKDYKNLCVCMCEKVIHFQRLSSSNFCINTFLCLHMMLMSHGCNSYDLKNC